MTVNPFAGDTKGEESAEDLKKETVNTSLEDKKKWMKSIITEAGAKGKDVDKAVNQIVKLLNLR